MFKLSLHIDLYCPGPFINRRIPEIKLASAIDWLFCPNHSHFRGGIICTVHPAKLPDPLIIKPFISLTLCLVLLCLAFINSLEQLRMQLNLDGDWGVLFPADSNLHSSKICHRICARHHNTDANYILIIKHSNKQTERKSPIITRF